jgi:hypothetical protein
VCNSVAVFGAKRAMKTHIIDTFGYISRLTDIHVFLDFALNAMDHPEAHQKALAKWTAGIPRLVRNEKLIDREYVPGGDFEKFALHFEERLRESFLNKFKRSRVIFLNLSLVLMCTNLELFFVHVLASIFTANPKALLTLSKERSISVEEFLKNSTYDSVLEEFIKRTTDHIIRHGTKEILETFHKIGIKTEDVFSWAKFTEEVRVRFSGWDGGRLRRIFSERHSIVHNNSYPLKSVESLLLRQEFFIKLILNISFLAQAKFYKYGVICALTDQALNTNKV